MNPAVNRRPGGALFAVVQFRTTLIDQEKQK